MPNPLSPDEQAKVNAYWSIATPSVGVASPFDQGASAIGIAPPAPPPQALAPAASPADPFGAGASKAGIAPPAGERVYNDFLPPPGVAGPAPPVSNPSLVEGPRSPLGGDAKPISAPVATKGPSARDDAEFDAFRAKQDADKAARDAKIAAHWGVAPAKANPDPYGIKAAQGAQVDAYGRRAEDATRVGDAEAAKLAIVDEHQQALARMQQEDAAIANAESAYAQRHFDEGMQEIGRQLDDVNAKKVDPLRMMKEQPALGVLAVLGGALGGFYQGFTGGATNQFLADLNRQLDRGQAEDERQIADKKWTIGQGANLLAQQRESQKDHDLAAMQTRNLGYEAAKQQLAADAANADIPAVKARADDLTQQINIAQGQLQEQIGQKKQAQANAAAGAQFAQAKEVQQTYKETYEKVLASTGDPAVAESEAKRLVQMMYLGGAGARPAAPAGGLGGSMTREQRGKLSMDHSEAQRENDEFNTQIETIKKLPVLRESGITTGPLAHLGSRIAPESSNERQAIDQINMQLLSAIGKVAKDADGKPNKTMIEEFRNTYFLDTGESVPMKLQKLDGAQSYVNGLARQQGAASAPTPNRAANAAVELGAKPVR